MSKEDLEDLIKPRSVEDPGIEEGDSKEDIGHSYTTL